MKLIFLICAITWSFTTTAAGRGGHAGTSGSAPVASTPVAPAPAPTAPSANSGPANSCEIDVPQALIVGNVDAFEFDDSFGVTFGYSPTGTKSVVSGNASILVSNSSMALTMLAADPISQIDLYSSSVRQTQTDTTINATINFSEFNAKPTAILDTPLAQVTLDGLTLGLDGLFSHLDTLPWIGRVLQMQDGIVVLNAGYLANVKVGDKFTVNNVLNFWAGEPCQSEYENSVTMDKPAGVLTIFSVSDSTSFGTLSQVDPTQMVQPGAEVRIKALSGPRGARQLKKKVKLGTIAAKPITIPGGTSFDFGNALNSQIKSVILQSNYVAD